MSIILFMHHYLFQEQPDDPDKKNKPWTQKDLDEWLKTDEAKKQDAKNREFAQKIKPPDKKPSSSKK